MGMTRERAARLAWGSLPELVDEHAVEVRHQGELLGESTGVGRYAPEVRATIYFCTLEALENVAKCAGATLARIRLDREDGHVTFEIEDDGAGFDVGATGYGTGLRGMADRLDAIGGSLDVRSAPGRGTTIAGRVPVTTRVETP